MSDERPVRVRCAPARLDDEQASAFILAQIAAAERNPTIVDIQESSSEDEIDDELGPVEGEERKESDTRPPVLVWSKEHTNIRHHRFLPPQRIHHQQSQSHPPNPRRSLSSRAYCALRSS